MCMGKGKVEGSVGGDVEEERKKLNEKFAVLCSRWR